MELCQCSLRAIIKENKKPMSEKKIRKIMRDVCLGLKGLHKKQIVHLDIKPENVLFSNSKKFKIADLGLARLATKLEGNVPEGDSRYLPLELLNEDPTSAVPDLSKSDIFSLGVMIYELISNQPLPMKGIEWTNIRRGKISLDEFTEYSKELRELVLMMIQEDPTRRPSAKDILKNYLPSSKEIELHKLRIENMKLKEEVFKLKSLCNGIYL